MIVSFLKKEVGEILKYIYVLFSMNKSLLLYIEKNRRLNVKFQTSGIFHCLGLDRIKNLPKNLNKNQVLKMIKNNSSKFFDNFIENNTKLSKSNKNIIIRKWQAFIIFFKQFDTKVIKEFLDFKLSEYYDMDNSIYPIFCLSFKSSVIVCKVNYSEEPNKAHKKGHTFYNVHILSLRDNFPKKIMKHIKIEKMHLVTR